MTSLGEIPKRPYRRRLEIGWGLFMAYAGSNPALSVCPYQRKNEASHNYRLLRAGRFSSLLESETTCWRLDSTRSLEQPQVPRARPLCHFTAEKWFGCLPHRSEARQSRDAGGRGSQLQIDIRNCTDQLSHQ